MGGFENVSPYNTSVDSLREESEGVDLQSKNWIQRNGRVNMHVEMA